MSISHNKASQLIHADLDGTLSPDDRVVLESHLSGCPECRAQGLYMAYLDRHLSTSLSGRWSKKNVTLAELSKITERVETETKGRFPIIRQGVGCLMSAAQFTAIAAVMAVMAWMLGAFSGKANLAAEPGTETATPDITLTATSEGPCVMTAIGQINIYDYPLLPGQIVGTFEAGHILAVEASYQDSQQVVWYQVPEGWVFFGGALSQQGDCTGIPMFDDTTLPEQPAQDTPTAFPAGLTPVATQTPTPSGSPTATATTTPVTPEGCRVAAYTTLDVWAGPGEQYGWLGTITEGTQITVYGRASDANQITWLLVGTQGAPSGWVPWYAWQAGNILASCPSVPVVNDVTPLPTLTPAPPTATFTPTGESTVVGCSQTVINGMVDVPAPFVRVGVTLASDLTKQLALAVVEVRADGSFTATLTYPSQPERTRLIISFGEWDGSKFLQPATMLGKDCVGS